MQLKRRFFFGFVLLALGLSSLFASKFFLEQIQKAGLSRPKVLFNFPYDVSKLDNRRIEIMEQYILFINLYAPLFKEDSEGKLQPNFASGFEIKDDLIEINVGLHRTSDGNVVNAEDAAKSILRQVRGGTNSHGFLEALLIDKERPEKDVFISPDKKILFIRMKDKKFSKFVPRLLASADFAVIPSKSIGTDGAITGFKSTTGPFFIKEFDESKIILKKNSFYSGTQSFYPEIELITKDPDPNADALDLLRNGTVDIIPTSVFVDPRKFSQTESIFETLPFRLRALVFSKSAQSQLSVKERLSIGMAYKKAHAAAYPIPQYQLTTELFPSFSNGSLSKTQHEKILLVNSNLQETTGLNLKVATHEQSRFLFEQSLGKKNNLTFQNWNLKEFFSSSNTVDLIVADFDTSFDEDISLISYNVEMGMWGMDREIGTKWIEAYLATSENEKRAEKLRDLHFDVLSEGRMVPIRLAPYYVVTRSDLHYSGNKFSAITDFSAFSSK